jgi:hypothetical protein
MKRVYCVIHSLGVEHTFANTAGGALANVTLPLGFRDACAVVDAELVTQFNGRCAGPFRAFVGQPCAGEGRPA